MQTMGCETWREALSARLDGEEPGVSAALIDAHIERCPACATWQREAALIRRAAVHTASHDVPSPDFTHLARSARVRVSPLFVCLRWGLAALGLAQLALGLLQVLGVGPFHTALPSTHHGVTSATHGEHLSHESAAWNLAVGVGFLAAAARRAIADGLVPLLTAFVGLLGLLSINDITRGEVSADRLLTHSVLLAGYLLILALTQLTTDPGAPWTRGTRDGTESANNGAASPADVRTQQRLRLVPRSTSRLRRGHRHAA
ncbi:zf-HC2 domain-containing protein [Frankia sp. R43]|uniref:zf-HC2 domain-containing protein n=1 Tax=Frankia sp. R43 TaxID=269536 RepID=UPI0006CA13AE|nr:zf-HC2 domain-containing protein [Frankia sp. R43]